MRRFSAPQGLPPHITVLAPFIPPPGLTGEVETVLGQLFTRVQPFGFRLARVARWPLVVYLDPEPADPFRALTAAVLARFPDHPPYGGAFEEVIPHLTVAECERQNACDDPAADLAEVERAIVGGVPIGARATQVWLMVGNGRWGIRARFRLGG
jgi:hypothetical protein